MKNLLFLLFLGCAVSGYAQDKVFYIHGRVMDEKTGAPLSNASVFCQNTTTGTISNSEGIFGLRLNNGGYDMVVSYTGFETQVIRVSNNTHDSVFVKMKEESKNMAEVAVTGSALVEDGWNK